MSESNFCDAGSLVRRRVLEAGIRFDPAFRGGYEDWDFWLTACANGFTGQPFVSAFFRYRKRPESMLAGSHDHDQRLRAQLRDKHRWLYDGDSIHRLLPPQSLLIRSDTLEATDFTDPEHATPTTLEAAIDRLLDARARPMEVWQPEAWIVARPHLLPALHKRRLLHGLLWHLRQGLDRAEIATLRLTKGPDALIRTSATPPFTRAADLPRPGPRQTRREARAEARDQAAHRTAERDAVAGADLLMLRLDLIERHMFRRHRRADGSTPPSTPLTRASVHAVTCRLPDPPAPHGTAPIGALERIDETLRARAAEECEDCSRWRADPQTVRPRDMGLALRARGLGGLPLPLATAEAPRIGFVVPIFKFGGVEKCVAALARALSAEGIHCHLFVYGTEPMTGADWLTEPFASILQLDHPSLRDWSGGSYAGTHMAPPPPEHVLRDMISPLTGMDAVITTGCAALGHGLGHLRRRGVVTASWEHLLETGAYGRSYGTPYLALAYEAAFDTILTCSDKLRHWLHGHGIPAAKLLTLPNGPGFPDDSPRTSRPNGPLRVGFLGRLDRQKGIDRFLQIAARCAGEMSFSVTGAAVVEGSGTPLPANIAHHPPAYDLDDLCAAFARLDVLLMPSRDEGLPLSILEAQRAGVIPIVSDVGAVAEAVTDGENGLLLKGPDIVAEAVTALRHLAADPALRDRLSRPARSTDRWAQNAKALMARLQPLIAARKASNRSMVSTSSASDAAKEIRT